METVGPAMGPVAEVEVGASILGLAAPGSGAAPAGVEAVPSAEGGCSSRVT
jgi:hypothetical protein